MRNMKTRVGLLGLVVLAFLVSGCENKSKIEQLTKDNTQLNQAIQQKDLQIKALTSQVQTQLKDLTAVKAELNNVKTELNNVNNKLKALAVPPAVPSAVPGK